MAKDLDIVVCTRCQQRVPRSDTAMRLGRIQCAGDAKKLCDREVNRRFLEGKAQSEGGDSVRNPVG